MDVKKSEHASLQVEVSSSKRYTRGLARTKQNKTQQTKKAKKVFRKPMIAFFYGGSGYYLP